MSGMASVLEIAPAAEILRPGSAEALAAELARARAAGRRVLPAGCGSRLTAAGLAREADVVLTTEALGRILQYEPADLTVTVEAGCTLAALDAVLAERGQVLPLQPGRLRGTVGGLVATAPEGATALAYGGVRDRLTGLRAALADGTIVKGGGRVVKNVAGYGLHRLMAGSRGTLGVIVEASFRVQPRAEAQGSVVFELGDDDGPIDAARRVLDSGLEPVFVEVLIDDVARRIAVGFDGMGERVAAHLERVTELVAPARPRGRRVLGPDEDARLRRVLDDWTDPEAVFPGSPDTSSIEGRRPGTRAPVGAVLRVTDLPDRIARTARLARPGRGNEGGPGNGKGSAKWSAQGIGKGSTFAMLDIRPGLGSAFVVIESENAAEAVAAVRGALERARRSGCAVVLAAPREVTEGVDAWGPPPPDFFLMQRLQQALDPDGVFARGGFVGGL